MHLFQPGADYGQSYTQTVLRTLQSNAPTDKIFRHYVWVCINPASRSFEKCSLPESQAVLQQFQQQVQAHQLQNDTFISSTGCILGCTQDGATVALASSESASASNNITLRFFRSVKVGDVDKLIRRYLLNQEEDV
jgi:hypothetical protein